MCEESMARSRGIEPRSQAPEAYVISIGPRAHGLKKHFDCIEQDGELQVTKKRCKIVPAVVKWWWDIK